MEIAAPRVKKLGSVAATSASLCPAPIAYFFNLIKMPRPEIRFSPKIKNHKASIKIYELLSAATKQLDDLNAWPNCGVDISIVIHDRGLGEGLRTPMATIQETEPDANGVVRRKPGSESEIFVANDYFTKDIGSRLRKLGITEADVMFFSLAHEIFHVDEPERQAGCGIKRQDSFSALAGATRQGPTAQWALAFQALTKSFRYDILTSPLFLTAGDIANEATADLTALYWMKQANLDWTGFSEKLVRLRRSDFKSPPFTMRKLFLLMRQKKIRLYDIADAIETVASNGLQNLTDIHVDCWRLAIQNLHASGKLSASLETQLSAL